MQGQQAQRVPHEHRDALIAAAAGNHTLEATQHQDVSSQAEVGFCLSATCGKPQEVGDGIGLMAPVRMVHIREAWQIEKDESDLKQTPTSIPGDIQRLNPILYLQFLLAHLPREDRVNALLPHGAISKTESFLCQGVCLDQVDPCFDSELCPLAALHSSHCCVLIRAQFFAWGGQLCLLRTNPNAVRGFDVPQGAHQLLLGHLRQHLHVQYQTVQILVVCLRARSLLRYLETGHPFGLYSNRPLRQQLRQGGVNRNPVTNRKLALVAIEHFQRFCLFPC